MKINKIIFNNIKYKLTVIFLAVLVWFFVKTEDNYRHVIKIPIRVTNLGDDRIITNQIPRQVKVAFWGKGRSLFSILIRKDLAYLLDVAKANNS
ncbi:MAG: hypothetical protein SCK70_15790, partial [bacterium]|nr:hypothetical protein [bacterium]